MNLQPHLGNEIVRLIPLRTSDFEDLYAVASDPKIWEQHPNRDRYKREVFMNFFEGAMRSGGAFKIEDALSGNIIGSTRFYDFDATKRVALIGYTFFARSHWGGKYNPAVKKLMLDYAFQFVERVQFHIGAHNIRSQIAIQRLGAIKVDEIDLAYYGEQKNLNFVFEIKKNR